MRKKRQEQRKTMNLLKDFVCLFSFASSFVFSLGQANGIFDSTLVRQLYWIFLQVLPHLEIPDNVQPQDEPLLNHWVERGVNPQLYLRLIVL